MDRVLHLSEGESVEYKMVRSKIRKSIAIKIQSDSTIIVSVPWYIKEYYIDHFIRKKINWIKKKQLYLKDVVGVIQFSYKDGSLHQYLGEKYVLQINHCNCNSICFNEKYMIINTKNIDEEYVKSFLYTWYKVKSKEIFSNILDDLWNGFKLEGKEKPILKVRKMKKRWGSMSRDGIMTLNISLLRLSVDVIESVVMHELCHLCYFNHSKDFYHLLSKHMPDWKERNKSLHNYLCEF